jgi:hypothetical protein
LVLEAEQAREQSVALPVAPEVREALPQFQMVLHNLLSLMAVAVAVAVM